MKLQTEGFVALGDLPNDERYPCLVCKRVPERVIANLFVPEPEDIPVGFPLAESKTLVLTYRLCRQCSEAKPSDWKVRLLMLERLNLLMERSR